MTLLKDPSTKRVSKSTLPLGLDPAMKASINSLILTQRRRELNAAHGVNALLLAAILVSGFLMLSSFWGQSAFEANAVVKLIVSITFAFMLLLAFSNIRYTVNLAKSSPLPVDRDLFNFERKIIKDFFKS